MALTVRCPVCSTEVQWEGNPYRPFCSERCQIIDLGAWVDGKYQIPGEDLTEEPKEKEEVKSKK